MIPLSLYIHLPWCVKKCPYCDFNSHEASVIPEDEYVDALLKDLRSHQQDCGNRAIDSIFIGGGTPNLFSPEAIARLLAGVRSAVSISHEAEVTMEANPGAIQENTETGDQFAGFRAAGINRISLGVQSFSPRHL
ncbi:MAG: radical SAM protein, partial [Pseudomonadales bacterium]